jgi:hypothetical protein
LSVIFGFFTGVLLYRRAPRPAQRESRLAALLLAAAALIVDRIYDAPVRARLRRLSLEGSWGRGVVKLGR